MRNFLKPLVTSLFLLSSAQGQDPQKLRDWKDTTGRFSITAELIRVDDENAVLRTENGKEVSVAIDKLSPEDRAHLETAAGTRIFAAVDVLDAAGRRTVLGWGMAPDLEEAHRQAIQNAIEQAVHDIVTSEAYEAKSQLLKAALPKLAAQSLVKSQVISEENKAELHIVKLQAEVDMGSLAQAITSSSASQQMFDGSALVHQAKNAGQQFQLATNDISTAIQAVYPGLFRVETTAPPSVAVPEKNGITIIRTPVVFRLDEEGYRARVAELMNVANAVSSRRTAVVFEADSRESLSAKRAVPGGRFSGFRRETSGSPMLRVALSGQDLEGVTFPEFPPGRMYPSVWLGGSSDTGRTRAGYSGRVAFSQLFQMGIQEATNMAKELDTPVSCLLVVQNISSRGSVNAHFFFLRGNVLSSLASLAHREFVIECRFLDEEDRVVSVQTHEMVIGTDALQATDSVHHIYYGSATPGAADITHAMVAPAIFDTECGIIVKEYHGELYATLASEDLRRIRSVQMEVQPARQELPEQMLP